MTDMALPRTSFTHGPKLPAVVGGGAGAQAGAPTTTGNAAAATSAPGKPRALVTGASSGIGWACAEALRDAGFEVIGTSRKGAGAAGESCPDVDDRAAPMSACHGLPVGEPGEHANEPHGQTM